MKEKDTKTKKIIVQAIYNKDESTDSMEKAFEEVIYENLKDKIA